MSDDHTTQAMGIYGSRLAKLNPTPVLDSLARQGIIFDNVFCTNSTRWKHHIIDESWSQVHALTFVDQDYRLLLMGDGQMQVEL